MGQIASPQQGQAGGAVSFSCHHGSVSRERSFCSALHKQDSPTELSLNHLSTAQAKEI